MGLNNAMLKFLNGFENTAISPNENYARELYELFALGEGNGSTIGQNTQSNSADVYQVGNMNTSSIYQN